MICKECGKRETKRGDLCDPCGVRKWRKDNPEKVKAYAKMRRVRDAKKIRAYQKIANDNYYFGGNKYKVLERDNYTCQTCNGTKETGKTIVVHHKDETGWGKKKKDKNNDMDNLISLCVQCHMGIHRPSDKISKIHKYPDLLGQDDSEYRFPKIREVLLEKKKKLGTIGKAKQELADELGMSHFSIDHMYYERKTTTFVQEASKINKGGEE